MYKRQRQTYPLQTAEVRRENFQLAMAPDWKYYRLHDYLMLNTENYRRWLENPRPVSYTHLRAHETVLDLVCRLLLEKKTYNKHDCLPQERLYSHHSTSVK